MTFRTSCVVALLLLCSCRSTPAVDQPRGEVVAAVKWVEDERVGAAVGPSLEWEQGDGSLTATFAARGDVIHVFVAPIDPGVPGAVPERWWWTRSDDEANNDGDAIPWRTVVPGQLLMTAVEISTDPPLKIDLRWTQGKVSGTVSQQVIARAVFDWRGVAHEAWFVDADMDGALGGAHDRWVAGPASRINQLKFPNPSVEMRTLDEPWCLGEHGITFRGWTDGAVRLDVGPPLDRSALRSRHAARLLNEFAAKLPRSAVLEKQGDSPDRPTTPDRAPWVYVDSWEEALAQWIDPGHPLIVEFTSNSCGWCYLLSWLTHEDAEVDREVRRFTRVRIDTLLAVGSFPEQRSQGPPATLLVGTSGEVVDVIAGFKPPSVYAQTLRTWRQRSTHPADPPSQPPPTAFEIESDFGEEAAWVPEYLSKCAAALVRLMDNPELDPPDSIKVELRRVEGHPGIAGWAAVPSGEIEGHRYQLFLMGFESDVWPADHFRRWILAHEMVNLFAHHYGGAGGYPSDFWSNGRSPFPEYLSCVVMRDAGYPEDARWRRGVNLHKPDHALYWTLDDRYGSALFTRFFKLLRSDDVRIGDLGDPASPWPAPDPTRSLYTIAYLSIAAGENLAPIFREAGVGNEPDDWRHGIRSEIPFREYEVRDEDIAAIMTERERLFGEAGRKRRDLEGERQRFREQAGWVERR